MIAKLTLLLAAGALLGGCALDALFFDELTATEVKEVPGAGNNFLSGQSTLLGSGAEVRFFTGSGVELSDLATTTGAAGAFAVTLSATTELVNALAVAADATRVALGIVPSVPRKETVYDPDLTVVMGDTIAPMADLGLESTFASLVILAQSRYGVPPTPLGGISPEAVTDAIAELIVLRDEGDDRVTPLWAMMERLFAAGATTAPAFVPFPEAAESYLDLTALAAGTDYDGDGSPDTGTEAFEAALELAVEALAFDICFPDDEIRVVMMVDFNEGGLDRNCAPINRWLWTDDEPGRRMFIVGSLHPDTPNCDTDEPPCIDSATYDAASQLMGNWVPNTAPMYDDGTNGDLVANDNIWTRAFVLPWFDAGAEDARWVRMHYKYTWGNQGQLWTSTEEWPGNSRFLELRDVNGDRVITRYDNYGDETTNKNAVNLLAPNKGGCGVVVWNSEHPAEKCANDTLENMIDSDGDCTLDTWPTPGSASPLTIACPDE